MKNTQRGFALLIAVIFMSVMLTFGLALGSLSYKQQVLASTAVQSQYAYYAADAALECALYADQQLNRFAYADYNAANPTKTMACDTNQSIVVNQVLSGPLLISTARLSFDNDTRCADVTIYKYNAPQPPDNTIAYLFSQGYDVSCATVASEITNPTGIRFVSRGLNTHY